MYRLIIAEKPSVAKELARALGADEYHAGYIQGNDMLVSWCIGHLVELATPEQYDARYAKWRFEDLPILPQNWKYVVPNAMREQFETLRRLMHDPRVDTVICATDAGREGELIFRLVYEQAGCTLPVKRLWISSLEEQAIHEGFQNLKDGQCYDSLYQAALCRAHADWLIGINASRFFSLLYGQSLRIGRVMSPTLAMLVKREDEIRLFCPQTFYTVQLDVDVGWLAQSERFFSLDEAVHLRDSCAGKPVTVTSLERRERVEKPPELYDLTALQQDANKRFGYTAQQTLDYAQALYERKLITYPRTDSRYLSPETASALDGRIHVAAAVSSCKLPPVLRTEQVIGKVSDHHAILPTHGVPFQPSDITTGEREILLLLCRRLVCAVSDPCVREETSVTLTCGEHSFTARDMQTLFSGWRAYDAADEAKAQKKRFPPELTEGQTLLLKSVSIQKGKTSPARRYTEATLLAAMEKAGNLPKEAERQGIGTPATRAATIEKLIQAGLMERKKNGRNKQLVPTAKGMALIAVVPQQIQSPQMTAEWEQRLLQIENGSADPQKFMQDIAVMLGELVRNAVRVPDADKLFPATRKSLGSCPCCGAAVSEKNKGFFCENHACHFGIWKDNRLLNSLGRAPTADMVRALLRDGAIPLRNLTSRKTGKLYHATLLLDHDENGSARLQLAFT